MALVISVCASHSVGRGFAPRSGHTKYIYGTPGLQGTYTALGLSLTVKPDCLIFGKALHHVIFSLGYSAISITTPIS